ncbi:VOC family protein [Telmatospirillum siberiense]|nr:VOC family protein [Telmatospirillum siberiense]
MLGVENKNYDYLDEPCNISGIEFVEFTASSASDFANLQKDFESLGFTHIGQHRSKDVLLFRQGGINLIINREPSSFAHSFGTVHGTSVCALAYRASEAPRLHDYAVRQGAQDYKGVNGPGELSIPAIRTISGRLIYLIDERDARKSIYDVDFLPTSEGSCSDDLRTIDHISQSVRQGETKKWVRFYSRCFGFRVIEHNSIVDPKGYVLSTVVADPERKIQICMNEPVDDGTDCERFLRDNFGEGVQHLAFATDDIFAYLDGAGQRGLDILPIQFSYYDSLIAEGYNPDLVAKLSRYKVMIDTEGGGQFLHAYVQPKNDRVFFEIVERKHHRGFGRHDVTARLMAQKGVVTLPTTPFIPPILPDVSEASADGSTTLMGVVGDPTSHLRMPEIVGHWLALNGLNTACVPFHVGPDALRLFVEGARTIENLVGFVVALPHKVAIVPLLDEISERAKAIGAVNVVRREPGGHLIGDIVDGPGFVKGLLGLGGRVKGAVVWLVGAGSAGRAIAYALAEAGVKSLYIDDLELERSERLAKDLKAAFSGLLVYTGKPADPQTVDVAVNATPSGTEPDDALPFDPSELRKGAWVADTLLLPEVTQLLSEAERHGCRLFPGRKMVESQVGDYARYLGWKD